MKLGISSYTFTWATGVPGSLPEKPLTAIDLVDRAAMLNVDILQIADNLPLENFDQQQLKGLIRYASDKGISIEMGSRGLTKEHTLKCLIAAEVLRSPILRMVIDAKNYEPDVPEIISVIKELIPEFRSRKIRLAIENHDRLKASEFKSIIQSVNSEWVGICLDSVNSMGAGEGFETVSEVLLPYTINLHIKDFNIKRVSHKMGFFIEGTPAGQGMLNIQALVDKLEKQQNCKSAILELWTPFNTSIEETIKLEDHWAKQSIGYLIPLFEH